MSTHPPDQITDLLDRAQLAMAANLLDEARRLTRAALDLDAGDDRARLLDARLRLYRFEPKLALGALTDRKPVDAATPGQGGSQPEARLRRACTLAGRADVDGALTMLRKLAAEFPHDASVLRALAGVQVGRGMALEAAGTLGLVAQLEPGDASVRRLRSSLLADTHPAEALEALGKITPDNLPRAAALLARCERWVEAQAMYDQWLDLMEHAAEVDPQTWLDAAAVAEALGDTDGTLDRLAQVAECGNASPRQRAEAHGRTGRLLLSIGRVAQAGRAFWRSARACETLPTQGDTASATTAWAGVLRCAQTTDRPRLASRADQMLRDLASRDERRVALAGLEPCVATSGWADTPGDEAEGSPLLKMLRQAGRTLTVAAEQYPNRADVHYHRAVCAAARGEGAAADTSVQAALRINPKYAAARALQEALSGHGMGDTFSQTD